jgi:uncharacterized protein with PQ loop repeat
MFLPIPIETIGLIASLFALLVFISPLAQIHKIFKIKKSDEVSPVIYMSMIINCLLWTVYGFGINNWYILTPNAVGVVFASVTLIVIYRYR